MYPNVPDLSRIVRRAWPKKQPEREPRTPGARPRQPEGFSPEVKAIARHRSGGLCEIDACGRANEYHHRGPRGQGGTSLDWVNQAANCLHVTRECHRKAEGRGRWSRKTSQDNGWLVPRNSPLTAAEVPVLYRGRLVRLGDDGSVTEAEGETTS